MGEAAREMQTRATKEGPRQQPPENQAPANLVLQEHGTAVEDEPRRWPQRVLFELVEDENLEDDQDQEAPAGDAQIQESSERL